MKLKCIVCGSDAGEIVDGMFDVSGATIWSGNGNYGSTVLDGEATLHIFVCDKCLKERAHMAVQYYERVERTTSFSSWDPEAA